MEGLRMTATLPDSPSKIRRATEVRLQGVLSMNDNDAPTRNGADEDDTTMLESLASIDEDETLQETQEDEMDTTEYDEPWRAIAAPPTIRRRRKPSDAGGADDMSRSLSFMEQSDGEINEEFHIIREDSTIFPKSHKATISGVTFTLACRAICLLIVNILLLCALLSHYTSSGPPFDFKEDTSMTLSEQQILLKSYLGDFEGYSSNVKLPAGGNPIDLIHLLHSSTHTEEEETGETISNAFNRDLRLAVLLIVVCTIMADLDDNEETT